MVTYRRRRCPLKRANQASVATGAQEIKETQPRSAERSTIPPSLLGGAASFLTTVALRAAQNYAADCLEEWIIPRRTVETTRNGHVPTGDDSSMPDGCRRRLERVEGGCEKIGSVLLVGGSKDD